MATEGTMSLKKCVDALLFLRRPGNSQGNTAIERHTVEGYRECFAGVRADESDDAIAEDCLARLEALCPQPRLTLVGRGNP